GEPRDGKKGIEDESYGTRADPARQPQAGAEGRDAAHRARRALVLGPRLLLHHQQQQSRRRPHQARRAGARTRRAQSLRRSGRWKTEMKRLVTAAIAAAVKT